MGLRIDSNVTDVNATGDRGLTSAQGSGPFTNSAALRNVVASFGDRTPSYEPSSGSGLQTATVNQAAFV